MPKLVVGDYIPNFLYDTPFSRNNSFETVIKQVSGKTALVFLRYYGCTLCQLDLHAYAASYDRIKENGNQLLVVLQSDPENLSAQICADDFPFDIVCDPDRELYRMLSVNPAGSMLRMMSPGSIAKGVKAAVKGYKHGTYEGDELQLPATFVVLPDRRLTFVHYGRAVGDTPTPEKLISVLK